MRIGYGFKRERSEFDALDLGALYLDVDGRNERAEMFDRGLRAGDVLVLLAWSDLGAGKGLRNMREALTTMGVETEVVKAVAPTTPRPVGRPAALGGLSQEQDGALRRLWENPANDGAYIIDKACGYLGENAADQKVRNKVRFRLMRRYGDRGKRKPPIDRKEPSSGD